MVAGSFVKRVNTAVFGHQSKDTWKKSHKNKYKTRSTDTSLLKKVQKNIEPKITWNLAKFIRVNKMLDQIPKPEKVDNHAI